jgi:hypothetical protein
LGWEVEQGLENIRLELRREIRSGRGGNRHLKHQVSRERRKKRRGEDHKYHSIEEKVEK